MTWTIWHSIALSLLFSFFIFLYMVRYFNRWNNWSGELCDLYMLEHMLPDGHPLEFMYKGIPRNHNYPRLLCPCIAALSGFALSIIFIVVASILAANGIFQNEGVEDVLSYVCMGSNFVVTNIFMLIQVIQNEICFKRQIAGDIRIPIKGKGNPIREEIEKKWPGFYDIEK